MNWDDLKLFLEVGRRARLDDAASNTKLDATTISRRIKRLEKDLGLTLFERSRQGHALTPSGEQLTALSEKIESAVFEILSLSNADTALSGRVRLGAPEGFGATVIAPALSCFREKHPFIEIDLIALSGFVSVPRRQADMSILLTRPTTRKLHTQKLRDYELYFCANERYIETVSPLNTISDLRQHTLIGYSEDLIYSSQLKYLQDILPGLSPQLCSPSIIAQKSMIASGAGVGILPSFMLSEEDPIIRVLPEFSITRTFWLVVHEDVSELARVQEISKFLTDLSF
ncbi:MAG: LysR family transcriptional regulator [Pseudomonadota bacterium]